MDIRKGLLRVIHVYNEGTTDKNDGGLCENILQYLDSQGVIMKGRGDLPKYWFDRGIDNFTEQHYIPGGLQEALEEAGYCAVEPLILKG